MSSMSPLVNFERWSRACGEVGVAPDESDYRRVRRAWSGIGRHYHTLTHLDACFRELDETRHLAMRPGEVELALWFHDAIYRSWRRDNEQRSAELAARTLRAASVDSVERIRQMVLATMHRDEARHPARILVGDACALCGGARRSVEAIPRACGYLPARPFQREVRSPGARQHHRRARPARVEVISAETARARSRRSG
jgi:predicted metal-dependent HD superfamily phosphohydrolase